MTIDAYMNPDFTWVKKLIFFAISFVAVLLCDLLIRGGHKLIAAGTPKAKDLEYMEKREHSLIQLFYEMIISATSVMSFACAYVVLNHVYSLVQSGTPAMQWEPLMTIWENGKDFVLLLLICLSCVLNSILDKFIIPLKKLAKEEIASVRMLSMFYVIIILMFMNVIGDESEYSPVMMYYLGLMVGRFVYFDASFADFLENIKNVFLRLPLLMLGMLLSGGLCYLGFWLEFFLERNYYIMGVFYTHLFLLLSVFILYHGYNLCQIFSNKRDSGQDQ
ncbi:MULTISPECIES: hypothetical protein [unclassified Butyrivibrio]|uniref:hypothetical protein n=1 Tax=unclassified Butyrivibrio TaxID=2639466 RepID=UPI0003FF96EB|nr:MULTISPECIES: hypothetical protein [unclassified Butyrivibrio]